MPIYLQFPGAQGQVTTQGFENWIELSSLSFGMDRPTDSRLGAGGYAATGKLTVHAITVTKNTDSASPNLTIAALQGAFDKTVNIAFTTTTAGGMTNLMSYQLSDCGIAGTHTTAGTEGMPIETYTLSFSKIVFTFENMDQSAQSNPTVTGYDLRTATTI